MKERHLYASGRIFIHIIHIIHIMHVYLSTDICVGQLAGENGISAQIMFHTSLDSPATQLKIYGNLLSPLCHHIWIKKKSANTQKHTPQLVQSCGMGEVTELLTICQ